MLESAVRHDLITNLKEFGHVEAIENSAGTGNPDVNYCIESCEGWIEVKYRREFPKRESTPALGKCFKPTQPIWFKKRLDAGAKRIFIYARIDEEFFLIPGEYFAYVEGMNLQQLIDASSWRGRVRNRDWMKLIRCLTEGGP